MLVKSGGKGKPHFSFFKCRVQKIATEAQIGPQSGVREKFFFLTFNNLGRRQIFFLKNTCRFKKRAVIFAAAKRQDNGLFDAKITFCGSSSVGRARPCQGRGREFESRFPLQKACDMSWAFLFLANAQV